MKEQIKYTEKKILEARQVAIAAHGDQKYDGIFPYVKHLDDVVEVLKEFGQDSAPMVCAGYLHDVIEDGGLSYNKIAGYFGPLIAEIVFCVTDELGRNRKERKAKTLPKIASNRSAVALKLADRIANIRHGGKIDMYRKEYPEFRDALFSSAPGLESMWTELEILLEVSE